MFARAGADGKKSSVREALLPDRDQDQEDHRESVGLHEEGGQHEHAQASEDGGSGAVEREELVTGPRLPRGQMNQYFWKAESEFRVPLRIGLDGERQDEGRDTE